MGATFLGPVVLRHYKTWVWSALHSDLLCNSTGCRIPKISTLPERTTIIWRLPNSLISSVNVFWSPIRYQVTCWEKNGGEDCTCPHEAYVPDHWFPKLTSEQLCICAWEVPHSAGVADIATIDIELLQFWVASSSTSGLKTCSLHPEKQAEALNSRKYPGAHSAILIGGQANPTVSSLRSFPHDFLEQSVWRVAFMHVI